MSELPQPQRWPSRLLSAAFCLFCAAMLLSWTLQLLQSISGPLVVIVGAASLLWMLLALRRRSQGRW